MQSELKHLIRLALKEDIRRGDITTHALIPQKRSARSQIIAKEKGIVAGLQIAAAVFRELDRSLQVKPLVKEGAKVRPNLPVLIIRGRARSILTAERVALNFLCRLSGIATLTAQFVERIRGLPTQILDTRKTTPGWRLLEKYAVRVGGGTNHRMGLYDRVLVKENHVAVLRGQSPKGTVPIWQEMISQIREMLRGLSPKGTVPIEIEIHQLEDLQPALQAQPDWILLDNFSTSRLRQAVSLRNKLQPKVLLEASGGVTLQNVRAIAQTGVDAISVGALTHSARSLNFSLEII